MWAQLRSYIFVAFLFVLGVCAFWYARYQFDSTPPTVDMRGIQELGVYAGDISCVFVGKDNYSVRDISVLLDEKPLIDRAISKKHFEFKFVLQTKDLSDGNHTIKIIARDSSRAQNESIKNIVFEVDNKPLTASFVNKSNGDMRVFQGHTLHIQLQVNKLISNAYIEVFDKKFTCVQENKNNLIYECFVPIRCEEDPYEHLLRVCIVDKVGNNLCLENKFQVILYPFKLQHLTVGKERFQEEIARGLPEQEFETKVAELSRVSPEQKLWRGAFYVPADMTRVSTEFGTLRVSQERGKYRHSAVDILAQPKSAIWADQDGVIVLKDRYAHSGNTVVIDHGCGVLSFFFHLEEFAPVNVGDRVHKGQPLGTLGKTGYASGYHLHWEIRICNIAVNPFEWTQQTGLGVC